MGCLYKMKTKQKKMLTVKNAFKKMPASQEPKLSNRV